MIKELQRLRKMVHRKPRSAMNRISPSGLNAVGNRKKNGTTLREISDAIGVSPSSIRRALARVGNKASPSAERTHKNGSYSMASELDCVRKDMSL